MKWYIYNLEKKVKDCSRGNTYHNKKFKNEAERRELKIKHHEKYGWTITSPGEKIIDFCLINDLCEIKLYRKENTELKGITGKGGSNTTGKTTKKKAARENIFVPAAIKV